MRLHEKKQKISWKKEKKIKTCFQEIKALQKDREKLLSELTNKMETLVLKDFRLGDSIIIQNLINLFDLFYHSG